MVKATLRDGRSAILFGVLSLLPQLCFSSIISVDETNVCPKLASNGLCQMKYIGSHLFSEEIFVQLVSKNERC